MTGTTPHRTPRGRDVVLEQIRVVGLGLRSAALVLAVVVGIVSTVIALAIVRGDAATWFDSDEWYPLGFVAFLFPFAVWRRETRFGPAFLWTLPVDRRQLALARVFAGWVWLMGAVAFFALWQVVFAAVSGVAGAKTVSPSAFSGATVLYLFGSAFVVGLRHPLRWLLGAAGVFLLLGALNAKVDRLMDSGGLAAAMHDARAFWLTFPPFAQWAIPTFLSLAIGLAALWAAVSRHGERRRH